MIAVHAAPDEALILVGHADGVVGAAFDVGDFAVRAGGEFGNESWVVDVGFLAVADGFADAGFAVGV